MLNSGWIQELGVNRKAGKIVIQNLTKVRLREGGRDCSGSFPKFEAVQNTPKKSGDDSRTPFLVMFCRLRRGNYKRKARSTAQINYK